MSATRKSCGLLLWTAMMPLLHSQVTIPGPAPRGQWSGPDSLPVVGFAEANTWEAIRPGNGTPMSVAGSAAFNELYCVGQVYAFALDPFAPGGPVWSATAAVMTKAWDLSPPDMIHARYNSNTVIAMDGSLVVIGGEGAASAPVLFAERCEPPEIFPGSSGQWTELAAGAVTREYHSVAVLLPNRQIFVGGGEDEYGGAYGNPGHTVEVYKPPYEFWGGTPLIVSIATPNWFYGDQPVSVTISLAPGRVFQRAALIRNGSVTHAFDMSQRYVGLDAEVISPTEVHLTIPPNGFIAPAGWYMLTVIDDAGVPSFGTFVFVG